MAFACEFLRFLALKIERKNPSGLLHKEMFKAAWRCTSGTHTTRDDGKPRPESKASYHASDDGG